MTRPASLGGGLFAVLAMAVLILAIVGCELDIGPEPAPDRWATVAAGADHTCALSLDGVAYCWGDRSFAQLGSRPGSGCEGDACLWPVRVDETGGYTDITAGLRHTCGIADSEVLCWGGDTHGQLGDGGLTATPCPGRAAEPRCSVTPRPVPLPRPAHTLSTSRSHTCALIPGGWAYCWGLNDRGQIGPGGESLLRLPRFVDSGTRLAQISAGGAHTCAVAESGEILCWGAATEGQLGSGSYSDSGTPAPVAGEHSFSAVAAGGAHTCGIASGHILCWGAAIVATDTGEVRDAADPRAVAVDEPVVQIAAGWAHTCAVGESGRVHCWGSNAFGQLGDGTVTDRPQPVVPALPGPATQVSPGEAHTCALLDTGEIYCWGDNDQGQYGNGSRTGGSRPVLAGGG